MAAATAAALDAADGVMDGRHFGRPIVQAGAPQVFAGAPQVLSTGFAQPAFGTTFGGFAAPTTILGAQPAFGGVSSTAAALDAADGVIDGRHFGRPIVQAGAPQVFGAQPAFGATTFGAPAFGGFAAPTTILGAQPTFVGGASSTAAALDAADGVIDGRHFGRPIVQAGAPQVFSTGFAPQVVRGAASYVQAPAVIGAPTFGAQPAFGATTFGATTFGAPAFGGVSSTAAALDAADGVIDGRHFGRPIVQAGAPQVFGAQPAFGATTFGAPAFGATTFGAPAFGSRAAQLDAADGVIDGKFYGRPIVQAGAAAPFRR